jgi:hypothetical protein
MLYMKPSCIPLNDRAWEIQMREASSNFYTHIVGVARGVPNSCAGANTEGYLINIPSFDTLPDVSMTRTVLRQ